MREVKFRAWLEDKNLMYEFDDYESIGDHFNRLIYGFGKYKLMQYTGLKDKNGKEIFEGDIIQYSKHIYTDCSQTEIESVSEPITGVFNFFNGCYPTLKLDDERHHLFMVYHLVNCENDFEVLGNIYENPELLEESQNGTK